MLINLIKENLRQILDNMDAGNTNISEEDQEEFLNVLERMNSKELTKSESANYIGVSVSTFDNYIRRGLIPKGRKKQNTKTLLWSRTDLDKFKNEK